MYLLIDAGNTRTKIGCHDGTQWLSRNAIDNAHLSNDKSIFPADFVPQHIVVANVGGADMAARLAKLLVPWIDRVEWLRPSPQRAGVRCLYDPQRLGADRWAVAIGAWHLLQRACLVVNAGTATTIDVLDNDGFFLGGCILPGLTMMHTSLARGTAGLPLAEGEYQPLPTNTADAIASGCLNAQLGAIERMAYALPDDSPIVLTGGSASDLLSRGIAFVEAPWLVLDGLLVVAQEDT